MGPGFSSCTLPSGHPRPGFEGQRTPARSLEAPSSVDQRPLPQQPRPGPQTRGSVLSSLSLLSSALAAHAAGARLGPLTAVLGRI